MIKSGVRAKRKMGPVLREQGRGSTEKAEMKAGQKMSDFFQAERVQVPTFTTTTTTEIRHFTKSSSSLKNSFTRQNFIGKLYPFSLLQVYCKTKWFGRITIILLDHAEYVLMRMS